MSQISGNNIGNVASGLLLAGAILFFISEVSQPPSPHHSEPPANLIQDHALFESSIDNPDQNSISNADQNSQILAQRDVRQELRGNKKIKVSFSEDPGEDGTTKILKVLEGQTDEKIRLSVVSALRLPRDSLIALRAEEDHIVACSYHAVNDGDSYDVVVVHPQSDDCTTGGREDVSNHEFPGLIPNNPRLPRVIVACLATGRYREIGMAALQSAFENFGGDCLPTFHLLTDNISRVPQHLNPEYAPYREWPQSGLNKFNDLRHGLKEKLMFADYFYFMDADVRFMEKVSLVDIAGDLVGVEHPMYPRWDFGWCKPGDPNTRGYCQFPYDRNPKSKACIPHGEGRYVKEGKYVVSTWYYFQSAFWGGKTRHVLKMFDELIPNIEEDNRNGVYSRILQDERHFNYYFWKHSNDSDINIRVLSPSYLYPRQVYQYTDWIKKENRPIIVHGIGKKSGKLIRGAMAIKCIGCKRCIDLFSGRPVGLFHCNFVADSQGWIREKTKVIRAASRGMHACIDGTDLNAEESVNLNECDDQNPGQQWEYNEATQHLMNKQTGMCLDSMIDPGRYPDKAKDPKTALAVNDCILDSEYQKFSFKEI